MKTRLGVEADLGPGHIVLDGDPAPPAKMAQQPPLFGPCLLWPRSPISATAELLYNIQDGARPPFWRIDKSPYLTSALSDRHELLQHDAYWPSEL